MSTSDSCIESRQECEDGGRPLREPGAAVKPKTAATKSVPRRTHSTFHGVGPRWRPTSHRHLAGNPPFYRTCPPRAVDAVEAVRTGMQADDLRRDVTDQLRYSIGRLAAVATPEHYYRALALAVRDRMQQRWTTTTQTYWDLGVKVACYLSAEFLIGPQLGNNSCEPRHRGRRRARQWPNWARISTRCSRSRKSRASATAARAGSRPAISTRWRRSGYRRSATASATNSESSTRRSATAGRWRRPTSGCKRATPGRSSGPRSAYVVNFGGHTESYTDERAPRVRWIPASGSRAWRTTSRCGLSRQHVQHVAAVEQRGGRVVRLPGLQRRRLLRRGPGEGRSPRR